MATVRELQDELARERAAHRATEELYSSSLAEIESLNRELVRVNQIWGEEAQAVSLALRECQVEVEVLTRQNEASAATIREQDERVAEAEADLSETHGRLTEAVVAATNAAGQADASEQAAGRLRVLVAQLEGDVRRVRETKEAEVESHRADAQAAQAEAKSFAERLRESETARLRQSTYLEGLTKTEMQMTASKRKAEQQYAEAKLAIDVLQSDNALLQQRIADMRASDVAGAAAASLSRGGGGGSGAGGTEAAGGSRRSGSVDAAPAYAVDADYARLSKVAKECAAMVAALSEDHNAVSKRLAVLTTCLIEASRADVQMVQVVEAMRGDKDGRQRLEELSLENERLNGLVMEATQQMDTFNAAITQMQSADMESAQRLYDSVSGT